MQDQKNAFKEKIKKTLTDNGFPEKKVTLPLEKMYEIAEEKQLNFNTILSEFESEGIGNKKISDKILFFSLEIEVDSHQEDPHTYQGDSTQKSTYENLFDRFKGMNPSDMMKNAQSLLKNMSPDELKTIQEFYQNMSPAEREELMKKAKDMGF